MAISIERILCPIDFSDYSQHALDSAVALARRFDARVIALHVFTSWPAVAVRGAGCPVLTVRGNRSD